MQSRSNIANSLGVGIVQLHAHLGPRRKGASQGDQRQDRRSRSLPLLPLPLSNLVRQFFAVGQLDEPEPDFVFQVFWVTSANGITRSVKKRGVWSGGPQSRFRSAIFSCVQFDDACDQIECNFVLLIDHGSVLRSQMGCKTGILPRNLGLGTMSASLLICWTSANEYFELHTRIVRMSHRRNMP